MDRKDYLSIRKVAGVEFFLGKIKVFCGKFKRKCISMQDMHYLGKYC